MSGSSLLRTLPVSVFVGASALGPGIPRAGAAQTGANVLVVINDASSTSDTIGRQYAERRAVPEHVEPFTHRAHDIYLVTRLDGYTFQDALAPIDRAAAPMADSVGASIANYFSLGTYRRKPLVPYSLDTLAWEQHLLGRHVEAASTIRALAADDPTLVNRTEIQKRRQQLAARQF